MNIEIGSIVTSSYAAGYFRVTGFFNNVDGVPLASLEKVLNDDGTDCPIKEDYCYVGFLDRVNPEVVLVDDVILAAKKYRILKELTNETNV